MSHARVLAYITTVRVGYSKS